MCPVVWPVHPRTKKRLSDMGLSAGRVTTIQPVSYLEMLLQEGRARFILTDSGGVPKEAYFWFRASHYGMKRSGRKPW
jgi:UDP-N-acetylglucosamine 2-epimerase